MHRIKGLEFDHVLVVGAGSDTIPYPAALLVDDELSRREAEWRERALLYVAGTRGRRSLRITATGRLNDLIR
jgi:superfamily I DNA/RNA helicase